PAEPPLPADPELPDAPEELPAAPEPPSMLPPPRVPPAAPPSGSISRVFCDAVELQAAITRARAKLCFTFVLRAKQAVLARVSVGWSLPTSGSNRVTLYDESCRSQSARDRGRLA